VVPFVSRQKLTFQTFQTFQSTLTGLQILMLVFASTMKNRKGKSTMTSTPQLRAELRPALLCELYRVQPLGRPATTLHRLVQRQIHCTPADVTAQLAFLQGKKLVYHMNADDLVPGAPPFWFITSDGITHCEQNHLV
jgi:hypothetical protein